MHAFLPFNLDDIVPEQDAPAPEKVIAGDPKFTTWLVETTDNETLFSGVWEATPGAWKISYDEWEFCSILSGRSVLTTRTASPGKLAPETALSCSPVSPESGKSLKPLAAFVIRLPS